MANIQPRFSYTGRSFENLRQSCFATVQATEGLNQKWTDFNESDVAAAIVALLAAIGDELAFMQDTIALEAFLPTARQRTNVVNLLKLIGYNLDPSVSAEGIVTFRWIPQSGLAFPSVPVHLPKYTRLSTSGPETAAFVTIEDITLPAGSTSVDVRVRQGIVHEEEFQATSDPYQEYTLVRTDVASNFDAVEVLIGQGDDLSQYVAWAQASTFLIESPEDDQKRFVVETTPRDQVVVKFGDGQFGAVPQNGFTILVRYLESVGSEGNIGANTLNTVSDTLRDADNIQVTLQVVNNEACVGGADRETIEHAKRQGPQELAALNRMVTRLDGDALISGLAGIGKAKVWGEQELPHPDIRHFNNMYVTFVGDGITPELDQPESWLPTTALKELILEFASDKKIITTEVIFVDPQVIFVDVQFDVYVEPTASPLTAKQAVVDALTDYFTPANQDFGAEIRYSNLLKSLDSLPNVQYIRLRLKRTGTAPDPISDPQLLGADPQADATQWSFDAQDIIVRRHEFCQLGNLVAADGSQNFVHFGRDDEPIRAKLVYYPYNQNLGVPITFDGGASSSPQADITDFAWNMGARGILLHRLANGQYEANTTQPIDGQTLHTDFDGSGNLYSQLLWKFTERPASGLALVTLVVRDAQGGAAAEAVMYDVRA